MQKILLLLVLVLLPGTAFGAGFAKQSLFLSKTPVVEGETVLVHAVVQNDSTQKFDGSLVFFATLSGKEKGKIGSTVVSIAPGGANTVSVSWTPSAGSYTLAAELTAKDATVVETQSANFTIDKKPAASSQANFVDQNMAVESSADVQAMLAKFSPTVADITAPAFLAIDSVRIQAGSILDKGIEWSKKKVGGNTDPGSVLGVATSKGPTPQGIGETALYMAAMVTLYVFSVLKWLVANAGVFYPVLAIGFLFSLWRLFVHFRRPSY